MKLGIFYTVFNGIELLKKSIEQIYNQVDEVVIVWQKTSNRGSIDNNVFDKINKELIGYRHKINFQEFIPNLNIDTKTNELNKHNLGLKKLRELNCSHFALLSCDHYYKESEFNYGKELCKTNNYDMTLTAMKTYYKHPTWQITPIEDYYMPFICKLSQQTQYQKGSWGLPYKVDPSVRINTYQKSYLFSESECMLHHYSMIRNDIENKFNNAAASSRWGDKAKIYLDEYNSATIESKLQYFGGRGLKEVENYFNL